MTTCRCGHDGTGPHRCHAGRPDPHGTGEDGSRWCPNEGVERFVVSTHPHALAGMQLKFSGNLHYYCLEHWEELNAGR